MKIASFIGALALSASVFFLFYQYWGAIATPIQIGILVTAPILFLLVSQLLKVWEPEGFFAKIVAMLALVSFVLNLAMLGQMFNINASPNAFAVWSVFAFILAYACNARLLLFFAIVLLSSFIAMEIGTWQGMYWLHFGERPEHFMLPAFGLFMLPIALQQHRFSGFAETYRICAMLLFFIATLILANYGQISYLQWSNDNVEAFYQVLGFVIAATLIYLGIKRQWPEVVATANVFFTLFLYTKVYDWFWHWLPKYLFFLLMALIAILALLVFKRLRGQGKMGGQYV